MKNLLVTLFACATLSYANAAENKTIRISTDNTDLLLQVGDNGRLYQTYLGEKLLHEQDLNNFQWNIHAGADGSVSKRGWEVYGGSGNEDYFEPAIAITHNDGNPSTMLYYVSSSSKAVEGGTETVVNLRDDQYPVDVILHYVAYPKENVIKTWSEIKHQEKKPVLLSTYASAMLYFNNSAYYLTEFSSDWAKEAQMSSQQLQFGKKVIDTKLGSRAAMHTHPFFEVGLDQPVSEHQGNVLMGTLGWTGNFRFTFEVDNVGNLRVIPGINPYASNYELKPNEVFITPEFIFTLSNDGAGKGSRNLHEWARNYSLKDGKGSRLTLLNNWENTGFNFNQEILAELMKEAKHLGVDMFLLDDGWFANKYPRKNDHAGLGDWDVNHNKLPGGIPALVKAAKDADVKFGIWIEPEMVSPKSELAEKHPEWIVKSGKRDIIPMRNQWLLDLSNPEVQDFVVKTFDEVIALSPDISYIKWDANRHVDNFGSEYLSKENQTHFWIDYTKGLYSVYERIRAKHPDVLIQLCSSGGGRLDFGALKYHDEFWASDNTNSLDRIFIQYSTNLFFPAKATAAHVSTTPNHQTGMMAPLKFRFDVAMTGRLGMELQPKDLTGDELPFAEQAIKNYKRIRPIVQFGDLYRLKSPYDGTGWASHMYISKDKKESVFFAYSLKYHGRTTFFETRLKGLDPAKMYKITELNKAGNSTFYGDGQVFPGDYLMKAGISLTIGNTYESTVLLITEQ